MCKNMENFRKNWKFKKDTNWKAEKDWKKIKKNLGNGLNQFHVRRKSVNSKIKSIIEIITNETQSKGKDDNKKSKASKIYGKYQVILILQSNN